MNIQERPIIRVTVPTTVGEIMFHSQAGANALDVAASVETFLDQLYFLLQGTYPRQRIVVSGGDVKDVEVTCAECLQAMQNDVRYFVRKEYEELLSRQSWVVKR